MNENLNIGQANGVEVVKNGPKSTAKLVGSYTVEHSRNGEVLSTIAGNNAITTEGKSFLFNTMFDSATALTAWSMGLTGSGTYVTAGDTYAEIGGTNPWVEFTTYEISANATIRGAWDNTTSTDGTMTSTTQTVFDITNVSSAPVTGLFICAGTNAATKSDSTNGGNEILWAVAAFDQGSTSVIDGDQLKITYTISA